jgi:tetraacyldisaccharide-1-P 4'-kinase
LKPGFLSRGYGGTLDVSTLVEPHHRAKDVGDEPLLLDRYAITVVSRRRVDGAHRLVDAGADLIIMYDGFQSARLTVDYTLVVIDSVRGIGNGFIIPAGPVRAPISEQTRQLSAILKVGDGTAADELVRTAARAGKTIYVAGIQPTMGLVSGGIFAFITSFINVELSIFNTTSTLNTVPVQLFNYVQYSIDPSIAAVSSLTILAAAIAIILIDWLIGLDFLSGS